MIDSQLRPNRVSHGPVIDAMQDMPRELFVPRDMRGVAYAEVAIEVVPGRFLLTPMVLARMIAAANIDPDDVVLQIGCATGYATAVLARMVMTVIAIEENETLVKEAIEHLTNVEADNAVVVEGVMTKGQVDQGPYDLIFINGGIGHLPDELTAQLAEGGRLVAVEMTGPTGKAVIYTKQADKLGRVELFDAAPAILPGFEAIPEFAL